MTRPKKCWPRLNKLILVSRSSGQPAQSSFSVSACECPLCLKNQIQSPPWRKGHCVLCYLSPKSNYDTLISDDSSNIRSPQLPELSDWRGNESVSEEAADRDHRRPDRRFSWLATCSGAVHILLNTALTLRSLRPRWATRQDQGGPGNLTNGEYSPMSWVPSTVAWNTPEKRDDSIWAPSISGIPWKWIANMTQAFQKIREKRNAH